MAKQNDLSTLEEISGCTDPSSGGVHQEEGCRDMGEGADHILWYFCDGGTLQQLKQDDPVGREALVEDEHLLPQERTGSL